MSAAAVLSTLVIVVGQSNALGFKVSPAELPAGLRPDPMVQIERGGRFETLRPGINTGGPNTPTAWGPEVEFARRWRAAHPRERLYVVKSARGSTGVAKDPQQWDWSPASRGEQYDVATAQVRAATARLGGVDRVVILWMGGETDTTSPQKAAAHEANLRTLFVRMRADWKLPGATIVIARIADEWDRAGPVRQAQTRLGAFSTDAFPMQPDQRHYSGKGQLRLGGAFYEAYQRKR